MLVKKKRNYIENKTCKAWLHWLSLQYPHVYKHVIKIDNEGQSNRAEAVACGLHVGASDYFIALPIKHYSGLWIEAKPDGWKLTKSKQAHHDRQMEFGRKMLQAGYEFKFCIGIDALIAAVNEYMA